MTVPQGLAAVQNAGKEVADQLLQLLLVARRRQMVLKDVILHIEVGVVNPGRGKLLRVALHNLAVASAYMPPSYLSTRQCIKPPG